MKKIKLFLVVCTFIFLSSISAFAMGIRPRYSPQVAGLSGTYSNNTQVAKEVFSSLESGRQKYQKEEKLKLIDKVFVHVYANKEKVEVECDEVNTLGKEIDNKIYGTVAGANFSINKNVILSAYLAYMGSKQEYKEVIFSTNPPPYNKFSMTQRGLLFGVGGMYTKDKYFIQATLNISRNETQMGRIYNVDDNFKMLNYSATLKGGYDFKVKEQLTIQPSLILMYLRINSEQFNVDSNEKFAEQNINVFHIEPVVKAKYNLKNNWTPYLSLSAILNNAEAPSGKHDSISTFKSVRVKNYYESNIGIEKTFNKINCTCYAQITGDIGARKGVGFSIGGKYSF